jgi:cytochrome c-type biogenesis protein CcmF
MGELGNFLLIGGWVFSAISLFAGVAAGESYQRYLLSRNSTLVASAFFLGALVLLGGLFLTDDYTNQFVWQFSNKTMSSVYKVSAIWGGMDGSMLLWLSILAVSGALLAKQTSTYPRSFRAWTLVGYQLSSLFFATIVVFVTNPFRYIKAPFIPPDGNGLNPLLQNPYMAVHPPMLYLGFTTFAIPFAVCFGALVARDTSSLWIQLVRRWTLIAWGFLTIGIVLGGHWAYLELGWGGFWAWDPVENSSFLPWLTGTAFLHSVLVQERKDMLKMWNVWLITLTYGLTVFGTFLTRSGVVQSVHAFASTDIGWTFLAYLSVLLLMMVYLTWTRRSELASSRHIESLFSREAAFLLNNLIFMSLCFAILWGVLFPVFSEALTGQKQTIGIPFFNKVTIPLFLAMIGLMGVGPLLAWKKTSLSSLKKTFLFPFALSCLLGILLVSVGVASFLPSLSYLLCFFVTTTVIGEYHRGYKIQRAVAGESEGVLASSRRLVRRHRSRYGGYLVHLGVVVMTIAITASMAHKIEKDIVLAVGETYTLGRFSLTLDSLSDVAESNYQALRAQMTLKSYGSSQPISSLAPEMRRYAKGGESTSEVALYSSLRDDFYVVLAGLDETGSKAAVRLFINPLQIWLWIGTVIVVLGTIIVVMPNRVGLPASARLLGSRVPNSFPKV